MGCGASKFDLEDQQGPTCRFQPFQRRMGKIVQPCKNDRAIMDSTSSTKGLLGDDEMQVEIVKLIGSDDVAENLSGDEKERGVGMRKEVAKEEAAVKSVDEEEEEVVDGDNEEEGGYFERVDSLICPGSPSFREYCTIDSDLGDTSKNDGNGDGAKRENNSKRKKGIAPLNSIKGSTTQLVKKGRKGRFFNPRKLPGIAA